MGYWTRRRWTCVGGAPDFLPQITPKRATEQGAQNHRPPPPPPPPESKSMVDTQVLENTGKSCTIAFPRSGKIQAAVVVVDRSLLPAELVF